MAPSPGQPGVSSGVRRSVRGTRSAEGVLVMPFTGGDVVVRQLNSRWWATVDPIEYAGAWENFTVPAGFRTDFASVPRPFVWLLPTYGDYTKAAILHDFMLKQAGVARHDADGLFRRSMRELGVPLVQRWMMWGAVRLGGRLSGAGPKQILQWLVVAIPSAVFLILPAAVILLWLALFWLVQYVVFLIVRPAGEKQKNRPALEVKTA